MPEQETVVISPELAEFFPERSQHSRKTKKESYEATFWIVFSSTMLLSIAYFLLFTASGQIIMNSASILFSYLAK